VAGPDYRSLFEEALQAGRNREYGRAVELLSRIVGSTDRYPQALLFLGRSYHALGDFARAAQVLQTFVRRRPDSAQGRFFLGRAFLALEEYPAAVRHLRRVIELQPGFAPGCGLLGLAYLKARRPDKAIWLFAKALELDPHNKRLQVGYLNTALVLAIRLFHRGDHADAARLFSEVLEQRPASMLPHLYLATIYREMDRAPAALYHMDAATQIAPQDPFLHLQKALILLSQGNTKAAAEEIRSGAQLLKASAAPNGSPDDVLRFITVNLFRAGRYRDAVFHGTRLLRGAYDDPQVHAVVAESYRRLGELLKAKNHYLRAIEKDRGTRELRHGLLAVLWERGEHAELLSESAKLLQKDHDDPTARYFHSLALARAGAAAEQVLAELQHQVRARGPDPVLMEELAAAYARAGLPELAEGWYERAMKLTPPSPEALSALADVYHALGRTERLAAVFEQYLALQPDDHPARRRLVRLLLEQDRYADAIPHITTLLPREQKSDRLKAALAVCYRRTERYADALVVLRDLLSRSPDSPELLKAAVYCLDHMGARGVAIKAIESFLKGHAENLSLVLMLGVLYYQDGALEKASSLFRSAVSLAPDDWRANRNLGMVYRRTGNEAFAEKFLARAAKARGASDGAAPGDAPGATAKGVVDAGVTRRRARTPGGSSPAAAAPRTAGKRSQKGPARPRRRTS
jgi:tetratricopeptide (TPR) repeat protein